MVLITATKNPAKYLVTSEVVKAEIWGYCLKAKKRSSSEDKRAY